MSEVASENLAVSQVMPMVVIIQHIAVEGPGLIAPALTEAGVPWRMINLLETSEQVDISQVSGLILMGGPMAADEIDNYPALAEEQRLVREAVDAGIPVLGVCLGHQIIAVALGGTIERSATREIGVAPIETSGDFKDFDGVEVVHWHCDNASLPADAELLASTASCSNQAFRYRTAVGMQFHIELDEALLNAWLSSPMVQDLRPGEEAEMRKKFPVEAAHRAGIVRKVIADFTQMVISKR